MPPLGETNYSSWISFTLKGKQLHFYFAVIKTARLVIMGGWKTRHGLDMSGNRSATSDPKPDLI